MERSPGGVDVGEPSWGGCRCELPSCQAARDEGEEISQAEAARLLEVITPAIAKALKRAGRKYVYPVDNVFTSY
jgi:hypothetical protein